MFYSKQCDIFNVERLIIEKNSSRRCFFIGAVYIREVVHISKKKTDCTISLQNVCSSSVKRKVGDFKTGYLHVEGILEIQGRLIDSQKDLEEKFPFIASKLTFAKKNLCEQKTKTPTVLGENATFDFNQ